eukprot:2861552-Pleurochrysis_carterae.AAC.2
MGSPPAACTGASSRRSACSRTPRPRAARRRATAQRPTQACRARTCGAAWRSTCRTDRRIPCPRARTRRQRGASPLTCGPSGRSSRRPRGSRQAWRRP